MLNGDMYEAIGRVVFFMVCVPVLLWALGYGLLAILRFISATAAGRSSRS